MDMITRNRVIYPQIVTVVTFGLTRPAFEMVVSSVGCLGIQKKSLSQPSSAFKDIIPCLSTITASPFT
ncbi:hypothetical protein BJV82DRAFT_621828 [Fennellomyces sp. T-0311]|nr:hypothetical protein BJV82DRAFT_621828 [Fennellomyces sp. T-0311]